MKIDSNYYVYILRCADDAYYIGITNDLDKRIEEHNTGIDPKCFTFSRRPVMLAYYESFQNANDALNREKQLKKWSRKKKEALIAGNVEQLMALAKNKANS